MNRNFKFLESFKNSFSQNIEIMVNEGCLPGCPFRTHHNSSLLFDKKVSDEYFMQIPDRFKLNFNLLCSGQYFQDIWQNMLLTNIVYPWDINTYVEKYNITKFKLVGRNSGTTNKSAQSFFDFYKAYMTGIEDFDAIKDVPFQFFNHYVQEMKHPVLNTIKIKDVIEYLPKLEYFEQNGYNCANVCGVECKYCYNLANKLKEKYPITVNYLI
jgi:collagenase-like PrtC family protease